MRWLLVLLLCVPIVTALDVPQPTGFVNDHGNFLQPDEQAQLEQILQTIEQNTTIEIAILTLPSLEGDALEEYATRAFREWGVGKADVNNGILILIIQDTREIRIEVGTGLEGVITDATAGILIRNRIAPAFRQGAYAEGLALAALDIAALASDDPATVSAYQKAQQPSYDWVFVVGLIATYTILLIITSIRYKNNKAKKEKARKTISTVTFIVGWLLSVFISSTILWFVLFFIIMVNVTTAGYGGFFFLPGPRRPGGGFGGGGFGGFGGGFSGGGGASGGW